MAVAPAISIVDDDESVRSALSSLLRSLGFVAVPFASAPEFLASRQLKETDCLISDVQLPGMSGLQLQAELIAGGHALPIIFITAFPEDVVRRRAESAGAIGFLIKPFDSEALIGCIKRALAG